MNEDLSIEKKYQLLLEENQRLKNEINELKQKYEPKSNRYSTSSPIAISSPNLSTLISTPTTLNGGKISSTTSPSPSPSSSSPTSSPTSSTTTISPSPTSSSTSIALASTSPSSTSIALASSPINISSSPSSPVSHQPISVSHSNSSSEDLIASSSNKHSKKDRSNSNDKDKDKDKDKIKDHTDSNSKGDKEKRKTGMGKKLFSKLLDPTKKSSGSSLNLLSNSNGGGGGGGSGSKKETASSSSINHQELINGTGNEADFIYQEKGLSTPYLNLPKLEVIPVNGDRTKLSYFSGPDYQSSTIPVTSIGSPMIKYPATYNDRLYCISTSTYPFLPNTTERAGDPIADRYTCAVYNNRLITCLADGCNWGQKPKEAAQNASTAFIDYVISKNDDMTNVKEVGKILFNAFECAHKSIMLGKDEFWEAGTTTLLGGVLLEINKGSDKWSPQWEFVCASVGDCKAYLLSQGEVTDITEGNRSNLDAKDCGGRLGPHLEQGKPDLRNLNIFCASVYDEDIIMIVSDGVHDNLDPKHLGKTPNDMSKEFNLNGEKWTDVDFSKALVAKNAFTASLLETLAADSTDPNEISNRILEHCWNTTVASRFFMENNAGKRLPEDYSKYPGKMDHTSIICFKVGHFGPKNNSSTVLGGGVANGVSVGNPTIIIDPHNNTISGEPFVQQNNTGTTSTRADWIKVSPSNNKYHNSPLKKTSSETNVFPNSNNNGTIGRVSISATSTPDLGSLKVSDGSCDSGEGSIVNSSDSSPRYK
ncbi:hypothetical protein ACTFIW_004776 [Dictyostelium discoideum]